MEDQPTKHQKHANLVRPSFGQYGRLEWAFLGTNCGQIQALAGKVIQHLAPKAKLTYIDADHASFDHPTEDPYLSQGANTVVIDNMTHQQLNFRLGTNKHHNRLFFNEQDVVLINGNHFVGDRQIVFIDPKKRDSLQRKLDRLTQVDLILLTEGQTDIYPFLIKHLGEIQPDKEVPIISLNEEHKVLDYFLRAYETQIPKVNGLVLAGGKSKRMGEDKGVIDYHGKPQREYLADLISPYCEETFLSCRPNQSVDTGRPVIEDRYLGLGPFGAIASAFQVDPTRSWLVVACDLPLLSTVSFDQLFSSRNPAKYATTFQSPVNPFPEPLITIWEPKSYMRLLQFLAQGYSCPRKVLINSDIELLTAQAPDELLNVNFPEERDAIFTKLGK